MPEVNGVTDCVSNCVSSKVFNGTSNRVSKSISDSTSNRVHAVKDNSIDIIATSPCDGESVPGLLEEIAEHGHVFLSNNDRRSRLQLLKAARSLFRALETPRETMIRLCWAEATLYAAIETAISMGLFSLMDEKDRIAKKVDQLASMAGSDPVLLSRIMKHLAAMGVIKETGPDEYVPTNLSRTLASPKYADGFPCIGNSMTPSFYKLSEYLSKTGYVNPTNAGDGPFQYAFNTSQHYFAWVRDHQSILAQFNNHMSAYHQGRPSWMDPDFYPVQDLLLKGARTDKHAVLLVDVGGGLGHDIEEFHRKHPAAPGHLVLQDLPAVLGQIECIDDGIMTMAHDFFTEQPIKGARAYYMHSILHDWSDEVCLQILEGITAAMKPGYSKLLINENVIPDVDADWQLTAQDIIMMTTLSSAERKEQQWQRLLGQAGLKILKIWTYENGVESLIECELV